MHSPCLVARHGGRRYSDVRFRRSNGEVNFPYGETMFCLAALVARRERFAAVPLGYGLGG